MHATDRRYGSKYALAFGFELVQRQIEREPNFRVYGRIGDLAMALDPGVRFVCAKSLFVPGFVV